MGTLGFAKRQDGWWVGWEVEDAFQIYDPISFSFWHSSTNIVNGAGVPLPPILFNWISFSHNLSRQMPEGLSAAGGKGRKGK